MLAIIDYRAGNLTSVQLAMEAIGVEARITQSAAEIQAAERVIFPGVGAAGEAMRHLGDLGLAAAIRGAVASGKPFLGICLGTQIILDRSEEDGGTAGLGIVPGVVRLFRPPDRRDKVPHMGWNGVRQVRKHAVFAGIPDDSEFYFVHSFHPEPDGAEWTIGITDFAGIAFTSALARGNLVATQFHPEKSGRVGLQFLRNFAHWDGSEAPAC